jgi:hypothetical protein
MPKIMETLRSVFFYNFDRIPKFQLIFSNKIISRFYVNLFDPLCVLKDKTEFDGSAFDIQ